MMTQTTLLCLMKRIRKKGQCIESKGYKLVGEVSNLGNIIISSKCKNNIKITSKCFHFEAILGVLSFV